MSSSTDRHPGRIKRGPDRPVPRLGLNVTELALSLGVSPNTVLQMVDEGRLPRPRIWHSRKIWIVAEIDAYLAEWPTDGEELGGAVDSNRWKAEA